MTKASLIVIGSELTRGIIQDRHTIIVSHELSKMGIHFSESVVIPDDGTIREVIGALLRNNDIVLLTEENIDNTIYDLVGFILKNENDKAIKLYKNFILNVMDSSQVIAVIASQIRLLFQVKRLYNSGKSNDEIAKILEFKSVYRVKYLLSDCYYYSEDMLIKYLSKLSNIDRDIKVNNVDGSVLLELFIAGKDM